jgi:hypothetical protein
LTGIDAEFHEYALAMPFIALSLSAYLDRRWGRSLLYAVPLVFVKEDLTLTVAALGVVMAAGGLADRRRRSRHGVGSDPGRRRPWWTSQLRTGVVLAAVGVGAAVLEFWVAIPYFRRGQGWEYWDKLPSAPVWEVVTGLFELQKIETLLLVVAVTAGAAVLSPLCLVAVPTLAWRMVSDNPSYWGPEWHYSMILMPIVFLAAIDGADALSRSRRPAARRARRLIPAVCLGVTALTLPFFPARILVEPATYQVSPDQAEARAVLAASPDGALIATDSGLMSRLTRRCDVLWLGADPGGRPPEYVLFDAGSWPDAPEDPGPYAEALYPGTHYVTVDSVPGVAQLERYRLAELIRPPGER